MISKQLNEKLLWMRIKGADFLIPENSLIFHLAGPIFGKIFSSSLKVLKFIKRHKEGSSIIGCVFSVFM